MQKIYKRFALVMVLLICTQGTGFAQSVTTKISYDCKNKPVSIVLEELGKQKKVPINFDPAVVKDCTPVTLHFTSATATEILTKLCAEQPVFFECRDGVFYIKRRPPVVIPGPKGSVTSRKICGRVTDVLKKPIVGATISIRGKSEAITDAQGIFCITTSCNEQQVTVTFVGYAAKEINLALPVTLNIVLSPADAIEESVQVNYTRVKPGTTLMSLDHIDGRVLSQTPTDIASSLAGKSPGLFVKYSNGSHSSPSKLQIRNNGWIGFPEGNEPLVIVDHTYLPPTFINQLQNQGGNPNATGSAMGGFSLWRVINPDEVESVEVLKDAAATSLYGSKGANGVIIVNTKKGKKGDPLLTGLLRAGIGETRRRYELLNTSKYVAARKNGFAFDGLTFDSVSAPDLVLYDSSTYTDFAKVFLGEPALLSHASLAVSGSGESLSYRFSVAYDKETSVLPGKKVNRHFYDEDFFLKGNLQHITRNGKLVLEYDGMFFQGTTHSIAADIAPAVRLFPNASGLLDGSKQLIWHNDFYNPFALLLQPYTAKMKNALHHVGVAYKLLPNLLLRANASSNHMELDESAAITVAAQDPDLQPAAMASASFGTSERNNTLLEALVDYTYQRHGLNTQLLAGTTVIKQEESRHLVTGSFDSDLLLMAQQFAANPTVTNSATESSYRGLFLHSNTVIDQQYLLDLTGRQDGSSRFGPDKRHALFWNVGAGWLLSNARYLQLPRLITFAKVRATLGTAGNDAIGDYAYQDIYSVVPTQIPGLPTFQPIHHQNKAYGWGKARKLEIAAECTLDSRFAIEAAWYRNITTNQLVDQPLPGFTGFGSIRGNVDARVESQGVEIQLQKKVDEHKPFYWSFIFTASFPRNRLRSLPGLDNTDYEKRYTIGQSLTSQKALVFLGVNKATGAAQFLDANNDGNYDTADYKVIGNLDPKVFGGFQHTIRYKAFTLDVCLEFAVQKGYNYLLQYDPVKFGVSDNGFSNIPVALLNQWRSPGQPGVFPAYGATPTKVALEQYENLRNSSLQLVDASYLRLKTICLSYNTDASPFFRSLGIIPSFFVVAENSLLFTKYKGADPNAQNFSGIPLLKKYCVGVKFIIK